MDPLQATFSFDIFASLAEFSIWIVIGYFFIAVAIPAIKIAIGVLIIGWVMVKYIILEPGATTFGWMSGIAEVSVGGTAAEFAFGYYIPLLITYTPPTLGFTIGAVLAIIQL